MYCDYIFIKARRTLRKIVEERTWSELRKKAKKYSITIPKVHTETPPKSTYPIAMDYVSCLTTPECQPLTNPDQLIGWDKSL